MNLNNYKFKAEVKYTEEFEKFAIIDVISYVDDDILNKFKQILKQFKIEDEYDQILRCKIRFLELFIMSNLDMLEFLEFYDSLPEDKKESYKKYLTTIKDYNKRLDDQFNDEMKFRI